MYKDYTISLAYDLAQTKQKLAFSDHSDIVSRRMGFIPLPLGVVMLRVIYSSVKSTNPGAVAVAVMAYICLFTFRVLGSIVILGKACDLIDEHKSKQEKKKNSVDETKSGAEHRAREEKEKVRVEETVTSTVLGHDRVEAVVEQAEEQEEEEMFQLPEQSTSGRLFVFQNNCEDRSDVILTRLNSAMIDDNDESDNEIILDIRDVDNIHDRDSSEPEKEVKEHEREEQDQERRKEGRVNSLYQHTPTKWREETEGVEGRKLSEGVEGRKLSEGLSPATKAKSLSSPDLVRPQAEYEDWENGPEEHLIVTSHSSAHCSMLTSLEPCAQNSFVQHPESTTVRKRESFECSSP